MLLCLSSRRRSVFEEAVEVAGEVALEAAVCFASAFTFLEAPLDVGDRCGVRSPSGDEDHVQCTVESAIAAAIEAVADRLARGGGDRRAAREACEPASEVIRPGCDQERTSCAAASGPTPGCSSSCGASLRVMVSISRASSRSSAVSCSTRLATERSASCSPRSSGSRVAARVVLRAGVATTVLASAAATRCGAARVS